MQRIKRILPGLLSLFIFIFIIGGVFIYGNRNFSYKSFVTSLKSFFSFKGATTTFLKQSVVEEESSVISVVDSVSPAVVSIVEKTVDFDPFSGPISQESGIGTGFIVDANGIIVTNNHVVSDTAAQYSVVLKDGMTYDVTKVHRDSLNDLAIIEVTAKDLPTVEIGDSSKVKVGQKAIAIGNALGQFSNTVTVGIISGLSRQVEASGAFGSEAKTYNDVLQTDAALNPGNSGGPLLNLSGQVIGVNVATTRGAENIGFAIPSNHLKPVLESFRENGKIIRPYLGVSFKIITRDLSKLNGFPQGAFITAIGPGTPAEDAGLKKGDIVTKIDDKDISEINPLDAEIQQNHKIGDKIKLLVARGSRYYQLDATLKEAPQE